MNTYNVVVSVSMTVCIDAESPDDATTDGRTKSTSIDYPPKTGL